MTGTSIRPACPEVTCAPAQTWPPILFVGSLMPEPVVEEQHLFPETLVSSLRSNSQLDDDSRSESLLVMSLFLSDLLLLLSLSFCSAVVYKGTRKGESE